MTRKTLRKLHQKYKKDNNEKELARVEDSFMRSFSGNEDIEKGKDNEIHYKDEE